MNELQLARGLATDIDAPKGWFPTGTFQTTVQQFTAGTLVMAADPGQAINAYKYGVLEFLSGALRGVAVIILSSNYQNLVLSTAFPLGAPQVGDQIQISGGPLQTARTYTFDPFGVEDAIAAGILYFVVIENPTGEMLQRGLGPNDKRMLAMEVSCETPYDLGSPGDFTGSNRLAMQHPILKEQVIQICYDFRLKKENGVFGEGGLTYAYQNLQRPGQPWMRAATINFEVAVV